MDIDAAEGVVRVFNDGNGIPVEMHKEVYVPELIFGHLLTSSNYDDGEKKVTGGRTVRAKLANIFSLNSSSRRHGSRERRYRQVFRNNMSEKSAPVVTKASQDNWTCISSSPTSQFNMTSSRRTPAPMCSGARRRQHRQEHQDLPQRRALEGRGYDYVTGAWTGARTRRRFTRR